MTNKERIDISKNKIFEASLAEFSEKGYAGSSVNNITKAGIPKGLLYHIYKNKDEIYLACVERCYRELLDFCGNSELSLSEYLLKRQKFSSEHPEMGKVILETLNPVSPSVDAEIQEIRKPFEEFNQQCFRNVLKSIPLRRDVNEETAMKYFTLVQSAMNSSFMELDEDGWLKHEEALPQVLDLMLYGIAEKEEK